MDQYSIAFPSPKPPRPAVRTRLFIRARCSFAREIVFKPTPVHYLFRKRFGRAKLVSCKDRSLVTRRAGHWLSISNGLIETFGCRLHVSKGFFRVCTLTDFAGTAEKLLLLPRGDVAREVVSFRRRIC